MRKCGTILVQLVIAQRNIHIWTMYLKLQKRAPCPFTVSATWYTTHVQSSMVLYQLYFVIHYCDNTIGKCAHRTPAGVRERHTCIGLMKSKKIYMKTPFSQLNLSSVELVWVECHVAETPFTPQSFKSIYENVDKEMYWAS
jgi:hypothetical protein